jgi:hypothetical protein
MIGIGNPPCLAEATRRAELVYFGQPSRKPSSSMLEQIMEKISLLSNFFYHSFHTYCGCAAEARGKKLF